MSSGPAMLSARGACSHESTTPPAAMASIPASTRLSTFSRKTIQAIAAVKTTSRLRSSDALAPSVRASPNMSSAGPAMPPTAIAAPSHGSSLSARLSGARRSANQMASPMPLPR